MHGSLRQAASDWVVRKGIFEEVKFKLTQEPLMIRGEVQGEEAGRNGLGV